MPYHAKYTIARAMLWRCGVALFDMLAPPRASELLLRGLSAEALRRLLPEGETSLPYRHEAVTALVWELKYRANARAAELAGALMAEQLMDAAVEELGAPLLIPVPMHESRLRERGYNQTEMLCEAALRSLHEISHEVEPRGEKGVLFVPPPPFEYAPDALKRTRATPPQQGLPRRERLLNLRGSMQASPCVRGRVCIIVDDVTTTGATFEETRRALLEAGARAVHCVALARS